MSSSIAKKTLKKSIKYFLHFSCKLSVEYLLYTTYTSEIIMFNIMHRLETFMETMNDDTNIY